MSAPSAFLQWFLTKCKLIIHTHKCLLYTTVQQTHVKLPGTWYVMYMLLDMVMVAQVYGPISSQHSFFYFLNLFYFSNHLIHELTFSLLFPLSWTWVWFTFPVWVIMFSNSCWFGFAWVDIDSNFFCPLSFTIFFQNNLLAFVTGAMNLDQLLLFW